MKKYNLFLLFLFCVSINIYGQNSRMIKSIYNGRYLTQKEIQNILPITTIKYGDINTKIFHSSAQKIIVWNHSNGRFVKTYEKNQDGKYIWFERNGSFYLELSSTKEETILLNESSGKKYLLTNSDFAEVITLMKSNFNNNQSENKSANEDLSVLTQNSKNSNFSVNDNINQVNKNKKTIQDNSSKYKEKSNKVTEKDIKNQAKKNEEIEEKTSHSASRICDYCGRNINYKQRFLIYVRETWQTGHAKVEDYTTNTNNLFYDDYWKDESKIYCSNKCYNESSPH